jgi:serine/threonine protein kinase
MEKKNRERTFLGEGSYANVWKETVGDKFFAIKEFKENDPDYMNCFLPEVDILMRTDHPNIIKTEGFGIRKNNLFHLVLELGTSLDNFLKKGSLSFLQRLKYIHDVGSGLNFLLKSGFAHGDMKLDNIIVVKKVAKLCDFSLICQLNPSKRGSTVKIKHYQVEILRSPELFYGESDKIDEKTEIWTYGYAVLSLIYNTRNIFLLFRSKKDKFRVEDLLQTYRKKSNMAEAFVEAYGEYPEEFAEIMEEVGELQNYCPKKRTKDLAHFLNHPLFRKNDITYNESLGSIKPARDESLAIEPKELINGNMLDTLSKWLVEVTIECKLSLQTMCLGIEIMRRIQHRYKIFKKNLQLFGCCCLFIGYKVTGGSIIDVKDMIILSNYTYDVKDFRNLITEMVITENGVFSFSTVYDVAKSKDSFLGSLIYLLNSKLYYMEENRSSYNIAKSMAKRFPPNDQNSIFYMRDYGTQDENNIHDQVIKILNKKFD